MKLWALVVGLAACSGGHGHPDAAIDTPTGDGPCGGDVFFTGEDVDFDSTQTQFCGIFMAHLQVHGDAARTSSTNPNGRFQLCLAPAPTTRIDLTPPTATSQCTVPASTYDVPGIVIADRAVIATGSLVSLRSFTVAREPHYNYLATKAQVFVHVDGTPRAVTNTGVGDQPLAFDGTTWALGATGVDVYFPNVDPTGGTTTIGMSGTALGTGSLPIAAGTFTYATLVAQ